MRNSSICLNASLCRVFYLATAIVAFIFMVNPTASSKPNVQLDSAAIAEIVGNLGRHDLPTDSADYEALCSNPRLSCRILIDSIWVIQDPMNAMERDSLGTTHMLTIIGMLHCLSGGLQFSAKSNYDFSRTVPDEYRRDWLDLDQDDRLLFLAYWLSHEQLFIAPEDAQAKIIKEWRNWFKKLSSDYVFKPIQGVDFYYWEWAWGGTDY
jgi:hypothetical protein